MNALRGSIKSRTIWLGLAVLVLGYLQENQQALAPFIPTKYFGVFGMLLGLSVIVVRFYTTQSLEEKGATPSEPDSPTP